MFSPILKHSSQRYRPPFLQLVLFPFLLCKDLWFYRDCRWICSSMPCSSTNMDHEDDNGQFKTVGLGEFDMPRIIALLRKCGNEKALLDGMYIHQLMAKYEFGSQCFLENLLVQMYSKCGALGHARQVFDNMPKRNSFSWNIMIGAYAQQGQPCEAFQLFQQMPQPDVVSWNSLLSCYAQHGEIKLASQLFLQMPERNAFSWTIMISGYVQQGQMQEALQLFQQMPHKNVVSWTAMISGYAQLGDLRNASQLFQQMPQRNVISWTAMVTAFVRCGCLNEAHSLFQQMPQRNIVSWNAMISGYALEGKIDEALSLFEQMPIKDVVSWTAILLGYARAGQLDKAYQLFKQMPERNIISWNTMVTAYIENCKPKEAYQLFQQMPKRDVVSWNAMIGYYAKLGNFKEAVQLFQQMSIEGTKPDKVTFLSILEVCFKKGALAEGNCVHSTIVDCEFDSDPAIQSALVNMYAKCGSLEKASEVFNKIARRNVVLWSTMITAYAQHGNVNELVDLISKMQLDGIMLNGVTLCSIISACSHSGFVDVGCHLFVSICCEFHLNLNLEHYDCIIDLVGRTKWLEEAEAITGSMPYKPGATSWRSLLGSCGIHVDFERGMRAAEHLSNLDPGDAGPFVLLSNILAAHGCSSK